MRCMYIVTVYTYTFEKQKHVTSKLCKKSDPYLLSGNNNSIIIET